MNWALHTEYFSREDEFIKKNMERIRWLETLHKSVRNSLVKREAHKPYKIKDRFGNWRDQVVDWYNEWTIYGTECEFKHLFFCIIDIIFLNRIIQFFQIFSIIFNNRFIFS